MGLGVTALPNAVYDSITTIAESVIQKTSAHCPHGCDWLDLVGVEPCDDFPYIGGSGAQSARVTGFEDPTGENRGLAGGTAQLL